MIIFDGNEFAQKRETQLKEKIETDFAGKKLVIAAILFKEDAGSRLYTRLKGEAAGRVGIEYRAFEFSLSDAVEKIQTKTEELNKDPNITGIIIQKPWRNTWLNAQSVVFHDQVISQPDPKKFEREHYATWWTKLTSRIDQLKDVDGLHPDTIKQIKDKTWQDNGKVLPATCQAVLTILRDALDRLTQANGQEKTQEQFNGKYIILGKSDLLGIPLFYELLRQGRDVEIIASQELENRMKSGQKLLDASVIVSATGRKRLVTGAMVAQNVVIIDVGEPNPDVDIESVSQKASYVTPVPGGVGPMTVISLLENCVKLAQ